MQNFLSIFFHQFFTFNMLLYASRNTYNSKILLRDIYIQLCLQYKRSFTIQIVYFQYKLSRNCSGAVFKSFNFPKGNFLSFLISLSGFLFNSPRQLFPSYTLRGRLGITNSILFPFNLFPLQKDCITIRTACCFLARGILGIGRDRGPRKKNITS